MTNKVSPEFHAEIILVFFNEYRDLRKVRDRAWVLLADASPEHLEAVVRHLPKDLVGVLPIRLRRAA